MTHAPATSRSFTAPVARWQPPQPAPRPHSSEPENEHRPVTATHGHDFGAVAIHAVSPLRLQPKLAINQPGDIYEQEADRVAEQVMRMPDPTKQPPPHLAAEKSSRTTLQRKCACGGTPGPTGECESCRKKREAGLQRKESGAPSSQPSHAPPIVHEVLRSPGEPLDTDTRAFFEPRFGCDFRNVRIHNDTLAADSAQAVDASAYSVGSNIVFAAGRYQPQSKYGRELLAHELVHTVQQSATARNTNDSLQLNNGSAANGSFERANVGIRETSVSLNSVFRQTNATGGTTPPRVVYIDANVFDQINRGNRAAAEALRNLLNSGADVRVPPSVYSEMVNQPAIPRTAAANQLMLQDLRIQTGAAPNLTQRVDVYAANPSRGGVSFPDSQVVASARAGNAEIWSFDRAFRLNGRSIETTFSVRVAPESTNVALVEGVQDFRVGRSLLGLEPVEISLSGAVTRVPVGAAQPQDVQGNTPQQTQAAGTNDNAAQPSAPAQYNVETRFTIRAVTQQAGNTIAEVEVALGNGLEQVNRAAAANGRPPMPARALIRVIVNPEGVLIGAEGMSGESAVVAESLAQQVVATIPRTAAGAAQGATGAAAGVARVSPWIRGIGWAAMVVFVAVTAYQYNRATPEERPRVLTTAGGGLAAGALGTYLVCNLALGIETVGWSLLICAFVAGGAAGMAGSVAAGAIYDAATATPLQKALHNLETQPPNVRSLFYSMVESATSSQAGLPITPQFIDEFLISVPGNLAVDELATLVEQLRSVARTDTLERILQSLRRAIGALPRRRALVLPPTLNLSDVQTPGGAFRIDALGSGRVRILPPERARQVGEQPMERSPGTRTILEFEL